LLYQFFFTQDKHYVNHYKKFNSTFQAQDICYHAIKVFEDLNAEHENVNMKVSLNKRCQSKKQHERQKRISPELLGKEFFVNIY